MWLCVVAICWARLMMLHVNGVMYQNQSSTNFNFTIFGIKYNYSVRCDAFGCVGLGLALCSNRMWYGFMLDRNGVIEAPKRIGYQDLMQLQRQPRQRRLTDHSINGIRLCGLVFMWAKDDTMHNWKSFEFISSWFYWNAPHGPWFTKCPRSCCIVRLKWIQSNCHWKMSESKTKLLCTRTHTSNGNVYFGCHNEKFHCIKVEYWLWRIISINLKHLSCFL